MPDGLDSLTTFQAVNAERRVNAHGSEERQRATVYASILEVDADRLAKYVTGLLRRVPAENRWYHREDLEQSIWTHLLHRKGYVQGNFEVAKLVARDAYKIWYKAYADERQLAVEAVNRSISLERAYARDHQERPEGIGNDVLDSGWVGWETAVEGNADGHRAMASLPEHIQGIVERKANGTPISQVERNQLSKFLRGGPTKKTPNTPTNQQLLATVLEGTHIGPIVWSKPAR